MLSSFSERRGLIMRSLSVKLLGSIAALAIRVAASEASADTIFYTSESAFDAAIGTSITDTYDSPGYATMNGSNAQMNKVFGETRYATTGFQNNTYKASERSHHGRRRCPVQSRV